MPSLISSTVGLSDVSFHPVKSGTSISSSSSWLRPPQQLWVPSMLTPSKSQLSWYSYCTVLITTTLSRAEEGAGPTLPGSWFSWVSMYLSKLREGSWLGRNLVGAHLQQCYVEHHACATRMLSTHSSYLQGLSFHSCVTMLHRTVESSYIMENVEPVQ